MPVCVLSSTSRAHICHVSWQVVTLLRRAAPAGVGVTTLAHVLYTNLNATEATAEAGATSSTDNTVSKQPTAKSRLFAGIETGIFLVHHVGAGGLHTADAVAAARSLMPAVLQRHVGQQCSHLQVECRPWRSTVPRMLRSALLPQSGTTHLPLWSAMVRVTDAFASEAVRLVPCADGRALQHVLIVDSKLLLGTCKLMQLVAHHISTDPCTLTHDTHGTRHYTDHIRTPCNKCAGFDFLWMRTN